MRRNALEEKAKKQKKLACKFKWNSFAENKKIKLNRKLNAKASRAQQKKLDTKNVVQRRNQKSLKIK